MNKINNNVNTVNTALAIFFTAFAVVVLVTGPVVIPAAIQEAQAVKGEADEHISDEGREQISDTGAENAGLSKEGVYCYTHFDGIQEVIICVATLAECQDSVALAEELYGTDSIIEGCHREPAPPEGAVCSRDRHTINCEDL